MLGYYSDSILRYLSLKHINLVGTLKCMSCHHPSHSRALIVAAQGRCRIFFFFSSFVDVSCWANLLGFRVT